MTEPEAEITRHELGVTILCTECGELIEVRDVAALVRTLHLENVCEAMALVLPRT